MAKFDHKRAHMAANLVSDPPVSVLFTLTDVTYQLTWGPQAIMFINITIEIRRNDRLSAAQ